MTAFKPSRVVVIPAYFQQNDFGYNISGTVDNERLEEDLQSAIDYFEENGYELHGVTPITTGISDTEVYKTTTYHPLNGQPSDDELVSAFGYSYTSALVLTVKAPSLCLTSRP